MKHWRNYLRMLFVASSLAFAATACSDDDEVNVETPEDDEPEAPAVVTIPDAVLKAKIREVLALNATTEVDEENILKLETLLLDESEDLAAIKSLTGLEKAANLIELRVGETAVTDLTPIKNLKKMKALRINNTAISDLSPLAGYTTLTYFNANTVPTITDISPLGGNTGMKEIILREVPFGNTGLQTIKKFTTLYRINMRKTGVTDITVLGQMMASGALLDSTPGAEEAGGADLDLRDLSVEDWSPIEPYLEQISNIEGLPK